MNFANIVKKNSQEIVSNNKNQEVVEVEKPLEFQESIEDRWSSCFSFNIIDLFSDIKYDFNILLNKCDINDFFNFVIQNSTIYNPYEIKDDSESEDEEDIDYYSD